MFEQLSGIFTILMMFAVLIGILALAYFTTRVIGGRVQLGNRSHDIKVIDRVVVDQNASLLLVQVAGETYLLGSTGQRIEKICQVDGQKLSPREAQAPVGKSFAGILEGLVPQKDKDQSGRQL